MANTLELGNGKWATGKDTVLAFNDENNNFKPLPFDFTRDTVATVVNKAGLIETVGSGEPRIDFSNNAKGALLLEPTRSNLITYSNGFDNATWEKGGGGTAPTPLVSANQGISPDGSNNAFKLELNLNGGTTSSDRSRLTDNFTGVTSTDYTFSFYAKAYSSSEVGKVVKFSVDNSSGDTLFTLTSEWKRFVFVGTSTGTNINQHIQLRGNESTSDSVTMLLYGYQAEQGSYATSYIPTYGSAATRSADVCNNAGNDQVINSTEGVLYAEISALANDGTNRMISLSDGVSTTSNATLYFTTTTNQIRFVYEISSVLQCSIISTIDVLQDNKFAIVYKLNRFELWGNGVKLGEDTSGSVNPSGTFTKLSFLRGASQLPFYGNVKDVRVYNTALTDAELQQLTTI